MIRILAECHCQVRFLTARALPDGVGHRRQSRVGRREPRIPDVAAVLGDRLAAG